MGPLLVDEDCEPLTTLSSLILAQDKADPYEKSVWLKRGAMKITQDGPQKGLMRSAHGHFVLPISLVHFAIRNVHCGPLRKGGGYQTSLSSLVVSIFSSYS